MTLIKFPTDVIKQMTRPTENKCPFDHQQGLAPRATQGGVNVIATKGETGTLGEQTGPIVCIWFS